RLRHPAPDSQGELRLLRAGGQRERGPRAARRLARVTAGVTTGVTARVTTGATADAARRIMKYPECRATAPGIPDHGHWVPRTRASALATSAARPESSPRGVGTDGSASASLVSRQSRHSIWSSRLTSRTL